MRPGPTRYRYGSEETSRWSVSGFTSGTDGASENEGTDVLVHSRPPEIVLSQGQAVVYSSVVSKSEGVYPLKDLRSD